MTKRELIAALEAIPGHDDTEVLVAGDGYVGSVFLDSEADGRTVVRITE